MDILDIDEALKDDSFIFLEDKTHDDVSNILQQWKSNNCIQQPQQHQPQQEQAYKLNSRTFTRPKRKMAQNLESQFSNTSQHNQKCNGSPILNLEIGGLVTNMQKSFIQDTSPPPSICASMDVSIDRMNNSLITSADFINVNFLQSANAFDFAHEHLGTGFNFNNKATHDGYTLSDMIRDRKALESLTLSGDGTLIKDCNIAQIDDISITLSKTASGCSTMDNSTESVETNSRTIEVLKDRNFSYDPKTPNLDKGSGLMHKTMPLSEEMIGDTTFNLVENSIYNDNQQEHCAVSVGMNITQDLLSETKTLNETFKKPITLDETISLSRGNSTFDCQHHTPEGANKNTAAMKFYESTPQAASVKYNGKKQYTPSIKTVDVNLSPIVAPNAQFNATRVLNETFENDPKLKVDCEKLTSETFLGTLPEEMLENVPNPNGTFSRSFQRLQRSDADVAMQNVMDLAQAEADLLEGNEDEDEFEHMLDEFSKVELNPEQLKMKKSLDSIKKRFTYGLTEKHERELSREAKDMREMLHNSAAEQLGELEKGDVHTEGNTTIEIRSNEPKKLRDSMNDSMREKELNMNLNGAFARDGKESMLDCKEITKESPSSALSSSTLSTVSVASNGGERLLSRRSRLYDDINLSTVSLQSKSPGSSSLTVHKNKDDMADSKDSQEKETEGLMEKTDVCNGEQTIDADNIEGVISGSGATDGVERNGRRLAEKRERDRDRFKTIKIVKQRTSDGTGENGEKLNVPCIDDDDMVLDTPGETNDVTTEMGPQTQRYSRRDHNSPSLNDSHLRMSEERSSTNQNYLTYKKPRDKFVRRNLHEIVSSEEIPAASNASVANLTTRIEPRSLSRPRYISGLQKFSVVSKATSAGDLEKTSVASKQLNLTLNTTDIAGAKVNVSTSNFNRTQPNIGVTNGAKELKSPMGIKSKSFHNLSSNFVGNTMHSIQKPGSFGLKKPTNTAGILTEKQAKANPMRTHPSSNTSRPTTSVTQQKPQQEKCDETVFKVPKLVSGIRAPSAAGMKRAGLVRPSSGYYSLNVIATAKSVPLTVDIDFEPDRHSPTDSMSSASSRNSVQNTTLGLKTLSSVPPSLATDCQQQQFPITLNKITTGPTGIPKPSGLRPPSNIKRSGLPRPASIVRR